MQLYRYFKGHAKRGHWQPVKAGTAEEDRARHNPKYGFCTVLSVSSEGGDPENLEGRKFYSGPFYIDIDSDGDVKTSILTARKVLKQLLKRGVKEDQIDVWLSGKKGIHIEIPQALFTSEEQVEFLPSTYRELAKALGLGGMELDWSVYSAGKGRCWRIPSRKREDNGQYKVISSVQELASLSVAEYQELCSKPSRDYTVANASKPNPELQTLFNFACQKAKTSSATAFTLIDKNLKDILGEGNLPPCARDLKQGVNVREDIGFNQKSLQMMKAVRAFCTASEQKSELEIFAINTVGDSYGTVEERRGHIQRSFGSVSSGRDYAWSCRSILSVLSHAPCSSCPIQFIRHQQEESREQEEEYLRASSEGGEESAEERKEIEVGAESGPESQTRKINGHDLYGDSSATGKTEYRAPVAVHDTSEGLTIHEGSYAFITKDGFRRVTNFSMNIVKVFIEHVPSIREDRRVAVQARTFVGTKYVGTVNIEEEAWNSSSAFTAAFNGIGNLTYLGKDEEVKRMKSSLLNGIEKSALNIRRVHSYGIHFNRVADQDVFTYVEPGWSVDNFGNEDLYSLAGRMSGAPKLKHVRGLERGLGDDKLTDCFKNLFSINQKSTIAALLGWSMASFLKQHVFAYRNEFPVVSVWGNAEAGKTQTTGLFAALHGIHYLGGSGDSAAPISLGGSGASAFAVWTSLSESTTVPKLVEEFNQRSLGKKYEEHVEHFKKVYNQHAIKRGTIRNAKMHGAGAIDAYTVDIPLTAPTLLISEQSIQVPALVQRCIQIQMNEDQRRGPGMEEAFFKLKNGYAYFDVFAKTAYMEAIGVPVKQVEAWIDRWKDSIPFSIGDRPHFCYCVCLAGLDFLLYLDSLYNLKITEEVKELAQVLVESTNMSSSEIAQRKTQSEADRVMNELAVMAELSSKDDGYRWLAKGQYYFREGNYLYLDGIAAHAQYLRFSISQSQPAIIATYSQFKELIRHTRYCESVSAVRDGFARGRQVMKFNISRMAERGIEVACFEESA